MNRKERRATVSARRQESGGAGKPSAVTQDLRTALSHHRAGRFGEAKRIYAAILSRQPEHPDALDLLGVIKAQEGEAREAVELIGKAIAIKPDVPEAVMALWSAYGCPRRLNGLPVRSAR